MEEVKDFNDELEKLLNDIRKGISQLQKLKGEDKNTRVAHIQGRIARAKQVIRSFKVELREIPKTEGEPWSRKCKEHSDTLNELIKELEWKQEKDDLMGGATKKDIDSMSADEVLDKAANIQDKSMQATERMLQNIEQSKGVAADTSAKLVEQTEKLKKIDEGIQQVESNLKQAQQQLKSFVRRMGTDKLIMCFILLIVIGIIFVIVWSATHKHSKTNVPSQLKPS